MQFRLTTHPNDIFYGGGGDRKPGPVHWQRGQAASPGFPAGEVDTGAWVNDVPNPFPDIIGKIAFDPKIGRTHQHIDAAVLVRSFQDIQSRH